VSFRMDTDSLTVDSDTDLTYSDSSTRPERKHNCQGVSRRRRRPAKKRPIKNSRKAAKIRTASNCVDDFSDSDSSDDTSDDASEHLSRRRGHSKAQPLKKLSKRPATRRADPTAMDSDLVTSSSDKGSDGSDTDPNVDSDGDTSDTDDDGYADATRGMIARMRDRWERYCWKKNKKYTSSPDSKWADPVAALRTAGKRELTLFLRWCLRLQRGKNGRG